LIAHFSPDFSSGVLLEVPVPEVSPIAAPAESNCDIDRNLFRLFSRSQAAISVLTTGDQPVRIRGDLIR
jgi:hypothetical protein